MPAMDPAELERKRAYRAAQAEAGLVRFISHIPAEDKELIAQVQFNRALRTKGNALSVILEEWQEMRETLNQENTATS